MSPFWSRSKRSSPNENKLVISSDGDDTGAKLVIPGDGDDTEANLEREGKFNTLQRLRYTKFRKMIARNKVRDSSSDLLNTERRLREVVQEELAINEDFIHSAAATERLEDLNMMYQKLAQEWCHNRLNLAPEGQARAFELWRSHSQWYMHSELVRTCADQQGCCARGCGCCFNRNIDASRSLGVGHCTPECGCCARARGFKFTKSQKEDLEKLHRLSNTQTYRSSRLVRISIWGLSGNSWTNPFEMINAPPTYQQSESSRNIEGLAGKVEASSSIP
ncbi:hypothetical protein N7541_003640 [Penicillium brevicompactum]|uniref:Uncharacterized protein n=1 Tax=Penicillium brevicompactum TaxID=5074 RepID=A0A9W9RMR2_PENBR|nr:hypothetical protein N7541_003640 [Penicillium brevicompactum]